MISCYQYFIFLYIFLMFCLILHLLFLFFLTCVVHLIILDNVIDSGPVVVARLENWVCCGSHMVLLSLDDYVNWMAFVVILYWFMDGSFPILAYWLHSCQLKKSLYLSMTCWFILLLMDSIIWYWWAFIKNSWC